MNKSDEVETMHPAITRVQGYQLNGNPQVYATYREAAMELGIRTLKEMALNAGTSGWDGEDFAVWLIDNSRDVIPLLRLVDPDA